MPGIEYSEKYRVPFGDTDAAGVVFYPNYYRWFDRMTHELMRHVGQPLSAFTKLSQAPVLSETGCRFLSPARYDDEVLLRALVADVRPKGFRVEHEVRRGDTLLAQGFESRIWVEIAPAGAKAIALPEAVRRTLSGVQ